jgi:hypothetical protein
MKLCRLSTDTTGSNTIQWVSHVLNRKITQCRIKCHRSRNQFKEENKKRKVSNEKIQNSKNRFSSNLIFI